jgi:iron complex transport system ATP-binding protein
MADACVSVAELTILRGGRPVVRSLTFAAAAGSVTSLVGPNGAGKSTALKAIMGLVPYAGVIRVEGVDVATLDPRARARMLAYVPQHSALDAALAVRDVVAQGRFAHRDAFSRETRADTAAVDAAMERTAIGSIAERPFNELSYGERRRVLLSRALATGAKVLLLDEPTAALDVGHTLKLFALLRELAADGHAVITVLHQLQEATSESAHVVLIADGRLVASGPPSDVISSACIREVYGVDIVPGAHFGYTTTPTTG